MQHEVRKQCSARKSSKEGITFIREQFCTDGEYGTKPRLEEKLKLAASPPTNFNDPTRPKSLTVNNLPNNDLMEAKFREKAGMDRNQEMAFELERYKEERKKIKLDGMNKEAEYMEK